MKPRWGYLVEPVDGTYLNTQNIGGVDFVINTSIEDVKYVNRLGKVIESPKGSEIPKGSTVILHHNVFRTYYNMKGKKTKSNEYFRENKYLVPEEKIYMYNHSGDWVCTSDFCFVSPIDFHQDDEIFRSDKKEQEHTGIVKYIKNSYINIGDKVAFTKNSEYEFNIGGEKLYRMKHKNICLLLDGQVVK